MKQNNVPKNYDISPLHQAAIVGDVDTIIKLLAEGADYKNFNQQHQLPIHCALIMPIFHSSDLKERKLKIFRLFKEKDAEMLKETDSSNNTVLHYMIVQNFPELINETLEIYPNLVDKKNNQGHCPIHTAILNLKRECVAILLDYPGVDSQKDGKQRFPLEYVFNTNDQRLIEICIKKLKDINQRYTLDKTALLLAVESGNFFAVLKLLDRGADICVRDSEENTVLHYAVLSGNTEMVRWLLSHSQIEKCPMNKDKKIPIDFCNPDENEILEMLLKSTPQLRL